jgi:hypothetical protein
LFPRLRHVGVLNKDHSWQERAAGAKMILGHRFNF